MALIVAILRILLAVLGADRPRTSVRPTWPPRGLGVTWLPDPSYRAFADYQRPGSMYDAW